MRKVLSFAFTAMLLCTAARAEDSLYRDLGGKDGIDKIVEAEMAYHLINPRIKAQFDEISVDHLKGQLKIFFCQLTGGPCTYKGFDMFTVHKGMHLKDADFNALTEDLQLGMNDVGVPFAVQNRLLAKLSPYERDIVAK